MKLVLGTRGSALALAQSEIVARALRAANPLFETETRTVVTSGDRKQGTEQAASGDKKDWIAELESELLAGTIDFALHSAKDVPLDIEAQTALIPLLERENPKEMLLSRIAGPVSSISEIPKNSVVGTASLRRHAQIAALRPDLRVIPIRGNVPTRISKLHSGECDFLVLAGAGLRRLGIDLSQAAEIGFEELLPAVNQGILVAQIRSDDTQTGTILRSLVHRPTAQVFLAEREVIGLLEADCHSAVAVLAQASGELMQLRAEVYSHDGKTRVTAEAIGAGSGVEELGRQVGNDLLRRGAKALL